MLQTLNEQKELLSPDKFVFWLQGFAEISGNAPTEQQWAIIKEHLELCFKKVTVQDIAQQVDSSVQFEIYKGCGNQPNSLSAPVAIC